MSKKQNKNLIKSQGGMVDELLIRIKLIIRLMGDRRVSPFIKIIPIGSLAYFVIPDLVIGPIDDALVVWLATYLFVELCPPEIVKQHLEELRNIVSVEWQEPEKDADQEDNIVDADFREIED